MGKHKEYRGYKFLLDDSKGCYIAAVMQADTSLQGIAGVALKGTASHPYGITTNGNLDKVNESGLNNNGGYRTIGSAVDNLCASLIQTYERKNFTPEAAEQACKSLHAYMESLPA